MPSVKTEGSATTYTGQAVGRHHLQSQRGMQYGLHKTSKGSVISCKAMGGPFSTAGSRYVSRVSQRWRDILRGVLRLSGIFSEAGKMEQHHQKNRNTLKIHLSLFVTFVLELTRTCIEEIMFLSKGFSLTIPIFYCCLTSLFNYLFAFIVLSCCSLCIIQLKGW